MKSGFESLVYTVDSDPDYRLMMMVSVYSLARETLASGRTVDVRVFCAPDSSFGKDEVEFFRGLRNVNPRIVIHLSRVDARYRGLLSACGEVTKLGTMCFSRFLLPFLMPDCGQCLYVDCDILFTGDPTVVLEGVPREWEDGASCAGVRDMLCFAASPELHRPSWYVNAGVLLMDLDMWRGRSLAQLCMFDVLTDKKRFDDQDTVNRLLRPAALPFAANFLCGWLSWDFPVAMFNAQNGTRFSSMDSAVDASSVIHYTGPTKPLPFVRDGREFDARYECVYAPYRRAWREFGEFRDSGWRSSPVTSVRKDDTK